MRSRDVGGNPVAEHGRAFDPAVGRIAEPGQGFDGILLNPAARQIEVSQVHRRTDNPGLDSKTVKLGRCSRVGRGAEALLGHQRQIVVRLRQAAISGTAIPKPCLFGIRAAKSVALQQPGKAELGPHMPGPRGAPVPGGRLFRIRRAADATLVELARVIHRLDIAGLGLALEPGNAQPLFPGQVPPTHFLSAGREGPHEGDSNQQTSEAI